MGEQTRRAFFRTAAAGLAAGFALRAEAEPTPDSGEIGAYGDYLTAVGESTDVAPEPDRWSATEDNILGPFHRAGALYRGKITPPLAEGAVLLIAGRVFGLDTRQPLPGVTLDIWQADHHGRYDNDDPRNPPKPGVFLNRARLITDEAGRYEYETIHPGAYRIGPHTWRPPHVHYLVRAPGYRRLITQLYFRADPHQKDDAFIKPSLIIDLDEVRTERGAYKRGVFDIVLAAQS